MQQHNVLDEFTREAVYKGAETANTTAVVPFVSAMLFATCVVTAQQVSAHVCDDPDCEDCNDLLTAWWTMSNEMLQRDRIEMQSLLRRSGIALPNAPWEQVPA